MTRADELALTRAMRQIVLRLAAREIVRNDTGTFTCCRGIIKHERACLEEFARRTRLRIAAHDIEVARGNAALTSASAPKPLPACAWCGRANATAVDDDGEPCCADGAGCVGTIVRAP